MRSVNSKQILSHFNEAYKPSKSQYNRFTRRDSNHDLIKVFHAVVIFKRIRNTFVIGKNKKR